MAPSAVVLPSVAELKTQNVPRHVLKSPLQLSNGFAPPKGELKASQLIFEPNHNPRTVPVPGSPESGKKLPTDHMITCEWSAETGWATPKLAAYGPISLAPTASVLHYATECFEGMKLYRGRDSKLRIFRPELNAARFRRSSVRCTLPDFDPEEMVQLILALCAVDGPKFLPTDANNELPDVGPNFIANRLLYIRPTMIGTDSDLGIKPPQTAMLFIIMSTFPSMDTLYLSRPQPGLKLLASPTDAVRAWPGGFGAAKLGANYGPSLLAQGDAARQGYDQVLWLYSQLGSSNPTELNRVTEAGASNFFVVWKTRDGVVEMVTAPTSDGTILEGVTRRSVLDLGKERLSQSLMEDDLIGKNEKVEVVERWFTMDDLLEATKDGRLVEAFAAGTAYFITPITKIHYHGADIDIPLMKDGMGPVAFRMRQWLHDIQFGVEAHKWAVVV